MGAALSGSPGKTDYPENKGFGVWQLFFENALLLLRWCDVLLLAIAEGIGSANDDVAVVGGDMRN